MKKVIVGSVLAAGVAASLFGAGSASAAPGAESSVGGTEVGIGDRGRDRRSGRSTENNAALAINTGLQPTQGRMRIDGNYNTAFALDGQARIAEERRPQHVGRRARWRRPGIRPWRQPPFTALGVLTDRESNLQRLRSRSAASTISRAIAARITGSAPANHLSADNRNDVR